MRRLRRILVAIKDPEARRFPAVSKAAQLARAAQAELVLFHALAAPVYLDADISLLNAGLADLERGTQDACRARLEAIARPLRRRGIEVSTSAQWDYPTYEAILREAARCKADLVVAERHAGRHIAAGLLHLTDWELLRLSPVPVLLVKRTAPWKRPVVLAAVDPDHRYGKPARLDAEILAAAAGLSQALKGTLHAVHAFVPLPVASFARGNVISEATLARLQADAANAARGKVQRLLGRLAVPDARRHVIGRHPADVIPQVAANCRANVLVMGMIARSGLKRLLIGNTAERILDRLACDVLIVKPRNLVKPPPRTRRGARYVSIQPAAGV